MQERKQSLHSGVAVTMIAKNPQVNVEISKIHANNVSRPALSLTLKYLIKRRKRTSQKLAMKGY
jgi:hypothetical protein